MRRCLLAAVMVVTAAVFVNAGGSSPVEGTIILSNFAPQDAERHIEAAIDRAMQINNGIQTLLTLNRSLQYQIQALEALSAGDWQGFIEFFDYQTAAVGGFSESVAGIGAVSGGFFSGDAYEDVKEKAGSMARAMRAANGMVRSADSLVRASEYNLRAARQGLENVANAESPMQSLQGQAQILAAIAAESRGVTQLLYTEQRYLHTARENDVAIRELNEAQANKNLAPPRPGDPNDPFRETEASDYLRRSLTGEFIDGARGPVWR
jgi:conjugal transfer/entry exclusion protein